MGTRQPIATAVPEEHIEIFHLASPLRDCRVRNLLQLREFKRVTSRILPYGSRRREVLGNFDELVTGADGVRKVVVLRSLIIRVRELRRYIKVGIGRCRG